MLFLLGTFIGLLLLGVPIFVATGLAALIYIWTAGLPAIAAAQQLFDALDKFPLLAVPFFILAGNLMNSSGITERLYRFAHALCGHLTGGLGHVNIVGSLIFSGMSGTALADAAGLGTIELKAMRDRGYDMRFAVGVTGASATIGPIIPPSLPMIIYGLVASTSVGRLFAAGILPGLLMAFALHVMVFVVARRRNYPRDPRASLFELAYSFAVSLPVLFAPVIIIGGILFGIFTPTEAAVVACVYAALIGAFAYRSLTLGQFIAELRSTFETTAVVMLMTAGALLFGWVMVRENVASEFTQAMLGLASNQTEAILILNVVLLLCGMFLDPLPIMLLATPLMLPVIDQFGIDRIQFGVVMVLNLMIGMMTPPVGVIAFVLSRLSGLPLIDTFRACAPWMIPLGVVLMLISLWPPLTLWLPKLAFG
jgi:tripartite ATP-independent transporter DctM subunit